MLVFRDHHPHFLLLRSTSRLSELGLGSSELNKSGSLVSTPNSFKSFDDSFLFSKDDSMP